MRRGLIIIRFISGISILLIVVLTVLGYCFKETIEAKIASNGYGLLYSVLLINTFALGAYLIGSRLLERKTGKTSEVDEQSKPLEKKEIIKNAVVWLTLIYTIVCSIMMRRRAIELGHILGNNWEKYMSSLSIFLFIGLIAWLQINYDLKTIAEQK